MASLDAHVRAFGFRALTVSVTIASAQGRVKGLLGERTSYAPRQLSLCGGVHRPLACDTQTVTHDLSEGR